MVYFILNKEVNHIKIGYSKNPKQRLKSLQTSSSCKLEMIHTIEGDISIEKFLHKQFKKIHIYNEWFHYDNSIIDFINFLKLNETKNYIIRYFDICHYSIEILKEVTRLHHHYYSYFLNHNDFNKLTESLKNFNNTVIDTHLEKYELINIIFDEKIDYNRFITDIKRFEIDDYEIESYLD